jgi:hypothetical protein
MTCIVGVEFGDHSVIGFDQLSASSLSSGHRRRDPKGWASRRSKDQPRFVFGATTSYRMLQVLRFHAEPPEIGVAWDLFNDRQWLDWMVTEYVPHVREQLAEHGFTKVESGREEGGSWMVGVAGRIFTVHSDFQVEHAAARYSALGCAASYALGAMHALASSRDGEALPQDIPLALRAAADHSPGVGGDIHLLSTDG